MLIFFLCHRKPAFTFSSVCKRLEQSGKMQHFICYLMENLPFKIHYQIDAFKAVRWQILPEILSNVGRHTTQMEHFLGINILLLHYLKRHFTNTNIRSKLLWKCVCLWEKYCIHWLTIIKKDIDINYKLHTTERTVYSYLKLTDFGIRICCLIWPVCK